MLKSWSVTPDDNSQSVETGEFQFTMPASDVTVSAEFIKPVDRVDPYIDENGEYHLGTVEHFELNGKNYAVAEDGSIGKELDSLDLSYFDFVLNGDKYQIKYYTGPTDNLTELVIPKTYNSKPITVLGTDNDDRFMQGDGSKPQFSLVLNENITEIKKYSFYTQDVKEVKGNTSGLKTIGSYAFSWGNSPDNFNIDLKLDYVGTITCDSYIFNHRNAALRLKHSTRLSKTTLYDLGAQSVNYIFTDAHTYGEPEWIWSDDLSSATAEFICSDNRCKHSETVDAQVVSESSQGKITYTATAQFNSNTYTDTQVVDITYSEVEAVPATIRTAGNKEYYEGSDDKLYVKDGDEYTETTLEEVTIPAFIDVIFNPTSDVDDNLQKFFGEDSMTYKALDFLGVQLKSDKTKRDVRFITVVNSDILASDEVKDYGYIFTATLKSQNEARDNIHKLTLANASHKYSCLDTYNTFTEEYGNTDFGSTDYKYVTAAINDIPEGFTIGSRFYVELKDGTVLYATYNPGNNSYDGCTINFDAYVASLG